MVVTVLRTKFPKSEPKDVNCGNFNNFDESLFKTELREALKSVLGKTEKYTEFENMFLCVLEKHAPMKRKY